MCWITAAQQTSDVVPTMVCCWPNVVVPYFAGWAVVKDKVQYLTSIIAPTLVISKAVVKTVSCLVSCNQSRHACSDMLDPMLVPYLEERF